MRPWSWERVMLGVHRRTWRGKRGADMIALHYTHVRNSQRNNLIVLMELLWTEMWRVQRDLAGKYQELYQPTFKFWDLYWALILENSSNNNVPERCVCFIHNASIALGERIGCGSWKEEISHLYNFHANTRALILFSTTDSAQHSRLQEEQKRCSYIHEYV